MDVSPGYDRRAVHGEGILAGSNNSEAHINSSRPDATGATLHDSLHFVPGLGDGRKSDGYIETGGYGDNRSGEAGLKDGFSHDQIMADTVNGFMLRSWETDFIDDALNGNGTVDELKKVLDDGN